MFKSCRFSVLLIITKQRKTKRVISLWIFRCKVTAFFIIFLFEV